MAEKTSGPRGSVGSATTLEWIVKHLDRASWKHLNERAYEQRNNANKE